MKRNFIRFVALVCFAALFLAIAGTALADSPKFVSTQNALAYLDEKGVKYTYQGVVTLGGKEYDKVTVTYSCDNWDSLTATLYFKQDTEEVSLRIWSIATVTAGQSKILETCHQLNRDYKFAKFCFDSSDNTVEVQSDMYIDPQYCGRSVYDLINICIRIADDEDAAKAIKALQ